MNGIMKVLFLSIVFIINSVSAQESGLLLGLRYGTNYDTFATISSNQKALQESPQPSHYRTFWIRAKDGKIELAAEKTNLLVPRDDGFWRVDVKHSHYNSFTEDFIWVNPAPDPDALPNPFLAEQEGIDSFDISLLVKEQGIEITKGEFCRGYTTRDVLFVGKNYLSVGYLNQQTCLGFIGETSDSALQLLSLDNLEPVEMNSLLDMGAVNAFQTASKEYKEKYSGNENLGDISGGIVRELGYWLIKGHFPMDKNYTHFTVPALVPESITTYSELYPDWKTITKQVPEAIDAFSSPRKDLLIVLTRTHLLGFNITEGLINQTPELQVLLKHPVSAVMARWAEGQYVSNWTQEIQNLGPKPQESWFTAVETPVLKEKSKVIGIVVTQNSSLNIRENIGQFAKPVGKVSKGSKLDILDVLGSWYKVQRNDGLTGYANSEDVKILPRLPYIQEGCPMTECRYGQWQIKQATVLYEQPSLDSESLEKIQATQMVEAIKGEIHTSQFGEIKVIKEGKLTEDHVTLNLKPGDMLFDLEPIGLNMHVVWYNGELYYLNNGWTVENETQWGQEITPRQTDWWVKVKLPDTGLTGWILNPKI